jgi:transposase
MVSTKWIVDTKMSRAKPEFVDGVRTNRTGRRTYTEEFKRTVVGQCNEPGVSLAAVAMAHRLNANLVRRWVGHWGMPDVKVKEVAKLLPVTIEGKDATPGIDTEKRATSNAGTIEIEVYGARIRLRGGVDVAALRSVLDALAGR